MAYIHLNRKDSAVESFGTSCLEQAKSIISGKRNTHGTPERCFENISGLWSEYLERDISPHDVAIMMVLFKIGRIKSGKVEYNADNYIDACGYAALADELKQQEVEKQAREELYAPN